MGNQKMSLMNCESCSESMDTDIVETFKLDDLDVCEGCFERGKE